MLYYLKSYTLIRSGLLFRRECFFFIKQRIFCFMIQRFFFGYFWVFGFVYGLNYRVFVIFGYRVIFYLVLRGRGFSLFFLFIMFNKIEFIFFWGKLQKLDRGILYIYVGIFFGYKRKILVFLVKYMSIKVYIFLVFVFLQLYILLNFFRSMILWTLKLFMVNCEVEI